MVNSGGGGFTEYKHLIENAEGPQYDVFVNEQRSILESIRAESSAKDRRKWKEDLEPIEVLEVHSAMNDNGNLVRFLPKPLQPLPGHPPEVPVHNSFSRTDMSRRRGEVIHPGKNESERFRDLKEKIKFPDSPMLRDSKRGLRSISESEEESSTEFGNRAQTYRNLSEQPRLLDLYNQGPQSAPKLKSISLERRRDNTNRPESRSPASHHQSRGGGVLLCLEPLIT